MGTLIPFEGKSLPSYLKSAKASLNDDLVSGGGGFPVISIKGKTFAIVRNGEREILPNLKDPDSPATSIDVVILKANKGVSKVYYAKPFEEGADEKPTCYSADGITPNADAQEIQSPKCAVCRHNQWGSRITESGKKGKACADNKRIAVTTPDQINEPYLMRVPPASLSNLTEYAQFLAKRGVNYNMAVTKISFDPAAATSKLTFKALGLLDEAGYAAVQEALKLEIVDQILGTVSEAFEQPVVATTTMTLSPAKVEAAAKRVIETAQGKTEAIKPEAAKPEAVKKTALPIAEPEIEVNLDNLSFDD